MKKADELVFSVRIIHIINFLLTTVDMVRSGRTYRKVYYAVDLIHDRDLYSL